MTQCRKFCKCRSSKPRGQESQGWLGCAMMPSKGRHAISAMKSPKKQAFKELKGHLMHTEEDELGLFSGRSLRDSFTRLTKYNLYPSDYFSCVGDIWSLNSIVKKFVPSAPRYAFLLRATALFFLLTYSGMFSRAVNEPHWEQWISQAPGGGVYVYTEGPLLLLGLSLLLFQSAMRERVAVFHKQAVRQQWSCFMYSWTLRMNSSSSPRLPCLCCVGWAGTGKLLILRAGETGTNAGPGAVLMSRQCSDRTNIPAFHPSLGCRFGCITSPCYMTFNISCQAYLLSSQPSAKLFSLCYSLGQPKLVKVRSHHSKHANSHISGATPARTDPGWFCSSGRVLLWSLLPPSYLPVCVLLTPPLHQTCNQSVQVGVN